MFQNELILRYDYLRVLKGTSLSNGFVLIFQVFINIYEYANEYAKHKMFIYVHKMKGFVELYQ